MMRWKTIGAGLAGASVALTILACTLLSVAKPAQEASPDTPAPLPQAPVADTPTAAVTHLQLPSGPPGSGTLVYDVVLPGYGRREARALRGLIRYQPAIAALPAGHDLHLRTSTS